MKNKSLLIFGKLILSSGIVIILLLFSDIDKFLSVLNKVNVFYYLITSLLILVTLLAGIIRWKILLDRFNYDYDYHVLVKLYFLSNFYNIFLPGGIAGDVIRGYKLSDNSLNKTKSYAIVFVDRFVAMLGFFIVGSISLIYIYKNNINISLIFAVIYFIFIILSILVFSDIIVNFIKYFKSKLTKKIEHFFVEIKEFKKHKIILIKVLIISILAAIMNIFAFYFTGLALKINLNLFPYIVVVPLIIILKLVPFTYEGLGLREAAMILVFSEYGISSSESMAISLVYFSNIIIIALFSGIISIFIKKKC